MLKGVVGNSRVAGVHLDQTCLLLGKMRIEVFEAHQQTPLRAYYEICLGAPSQLKNSSNFRRLTGTV